MPRLVNCLMLSPLRYSLKSWNLLLARSGRRGTRAGGFSVDCAATGGEALELTANGTRYDLIILDLGLPDLDGLNVLELLRARGLTVPVIVLTARTSDRERAMALGADAYFVKPLPFLFPLTNRLWERPGMPIMVR